MTLQCLTALFSINCFHINICFSPRFVWATSANAAALSGWRAGRGEALCLAMFWRSFEGNTQRCTDGGRVKGWSAARRPEEEDTEPTKWPRETNDGVRLTGKIGGFLDLSGMLDLLVRIPFWCRSENPRRPSCLSFAGRREISLPLDLLSFIEPVLVFLHPPWVSMLWAVYFPKAKPPSEAKENETHTYYS